MSKLEGGVTGERSVVLPQSFLELMRDNPLTGDLFLHALGHVPHARHHHVEQRQGSDSALFIYCSWGAGEVQIGDLKWSVRANQYLVIPAGIPYSYRADENDPWSIYWVGFAGSKAAIYAKEMGVPTTILPSVHFRIEQRIDLFEMMYAVLCGGLSIDKLNYANICMAHFLASFLYVDLFRISSNTSTHADAMVSRATHFMNENIERRLTLQEIASHVGYSESYFYRKFHKETDMAPIDYFIHMKVNKASVYLLKTSLTITQIAAKLGFSTPDYFSRIFTRIVGISASEFRKQNFRL